MDTFQKSIQNEQCAWHQMVFYRANRAQRKCNHQSYRRNFTKLSLLSPFEKNVCVIDIYTDNKSQIICLQTAREGSPVIVTIPEDPVLTVEVITLRFNMIGHVANGEVTAEKYHNNKRRPHDCPWYSLDSFASI